MGKRNSVAKLVDGGQEDRIKNEQKKDEKALCYMLVVALGEETEEWFFRSIDSGTPGWKR